MKSLLIFIIIATTITCCQGKVDRKLFRRDGDMLIMDDWNFDNAVRKIDFILLLCCEYFWEQFHFPNLKLQLKYLIKYYHILNYTLKLVLIAANNFVVYVFFICLKFNLSKSRLLTNNYSLHINYFYNIIMLSFDSSQFKYCVINLYYFKYYHMCYIKMY